MVKKVLRSAEKFSENLPLSPLPLYASPKISTKRKFLGRISRGHSGVIRADIPAKNFGQGPQNPGKEQACGRGHPYLASQALDISE